MKTTDELQDYYRRTIADTERYIAFLITQRDRIERIGVTPNFWGGMHCDFDSLTRPQLLIALKEFPGVWSKTPTYQGEGIDYSLKEPVGGFYIRLYASEPPPSCKIEETIEYKLVPERVERIVKRKIVCPEPKVSEPEPKVEAQSE
jgi:hypothetical protein